jgi:RHS repeat-associated protein
MGMGKGPTRMFKSFGAALLCSFALLMFVPRCATAQGMNWGEEYAKRIKSTESVAPLGDATFGDNISLFNGTVTFSATDISIPGNNSLSVELTRTYDPQDNTSQRPIGVWEIRAPHLHAIHTDRPGLGWAPLERCSTVAAPPAHGTFPNAFTARDYWSGTQLRGTSGDGDLLAIDEDPKLVKPTAAGAYLWVNKAQWFFTCLSALQSGPGEGFVGHAPDGTKYRFDWMVIRDYPGISRKDPNQLNPIAVSRKSVRLYATEVTDRFGNWVRYDWTGGRLNRIYSNDGREIVLTYVNDELSTAKAKTVGDSSPATQRTWTYQYTGAAFTSVLNPDGSKWSYASQGPGQLNRIEYQPDPGGGLVREYPYHCWQANVIVQKKAGFTITGPSGATAQYTFAPLRHGRTNVRLRCMDGTDDDYRTDYNDFPLTHDVMSLETKVVTGAALPTQTYSYSYTSLEAGYRSTGDPEEDALIGAGAPPHYKTVTVTEPDGTQQIHTFGKDYELNEGQLFRVQTRKGGQTYRTVDHSYVTEAEAPNQVFPAFMGNNLVSYGDQFTAGGNRPMKSTIVTDEHGETFSTTTPKGCASATIYCFDALVRTIRQTQASSVGPGYTKTDTTAYHDDYTKWLLGQMASVTDFGTGLVTASTTYDANDLPWKTYRFSKLQQTLTYNTVAGPSAGTVATATDGRGNTTVLANWKRGIPQTITFPATIDQPTPASRHAVVNGFGWISAVTDENGFVTNYLHDEMGRLAQVTYPTGDSVAWAPTTITFAATGGAVYGLPVNHWAQVVQTGNGIKILRLDALWRPVVEETYSTAEAGATRSLTVKRYDNRGRLVFQSYPARTLGSYADPNLKGVWTDYDALGRPIAVDQDAENNTVLTTSTAYLSDFRTAVTDPRLQTTTTSYMAYGEPSTDLPVAIAHPEGMYTDIVRDAFGKPRSLRRRNAAGTLASTRQYMYYASQELCKSVDPETGSTVMAYDEAGNLAWSAAGLDLPDPDACNAGALSDTGRRVYRAYDARNRLTQLSFPDTLGDQIWTYTPDGLPASILTDNGGGDLVTNTYAYNKRRLVTGEGLQWDGIINWPIAYGYNANGHLASQTWHGLSITYAPNALGQPTQVGSDVGTFASGVSYHPNGAIQQFTYGNGILHTLSQNERKLPLQSVDTGVLDDAYVYDANGNVTAKWDAATAGSTGRTMQYDGLNRLKEVYSPIFGGDGYARYSYDVLDNLTYAKAPGRETYYCYDASNHLKFLRTGPVCTGAASPTHTTFEYDLQGNLEDKNGTAYAFDFGNRLRSVNGTPASSYVYDGLGRRVQDIAALTKYSQYTQSGQLAITSAGDTVSEYIYLGGSLLAIRERAVSTGVYSTKYQHTDALGTPVAVTGSTGALLSRTHYEPYGKAYNGPASNGPGYTGHVLDLATGMNYMQQRYYDPTIGRFLSVDPVTADGNSGGNFNRYWYANNNPYKFTDPDGRWSRADKRRPGDAGASFVGSTIDGMDVNAPGYEPINRAPPRRPKEGSVTVRKPETVSTSNVQTMLENMCGQSAGVCAKPSEGSDYVHVYVNYWVGTLGLTLTKNGTLFVGGGPAHGTPRSIVSGKPGASITLGYMTSPTSGSGVDNFVTGATTSAGFFHGGGGAYSTNAAGSAIEVGAGVGGPTIQAFEYMTPVFQSRNAGE